MTLAEFLAARLDEDQMWAQAAGDTDKGRSWTAAEGGYPVSGPLVDDGWGVTVVPPAPTRAQTAHIARHDPARVLREVEAGRQLLASLREAMEWFDGALPGNSRRHMVVLDAWLEAVRQRAAVWSDHPDYDPDWAPPSAAEPVTPGKADG